MVDAKTSKAKTQSHRSRCIDGFLEVVEVIVYTLVGMSAGTFVGWLFGFYAGNVYVRNFQPVYASAYSSLREIYEWTAKPGIMADKGASIGACIGVIIALLIWAIFWRQRRRMAHQFQSHAQ